MKHHTKAIKGARKSRRVLVTLELETALTRQEIETIARAVFTTRKLPTSSVEQVQVNTIRQR